MMLTRLRAKQGTDTVRAARSKYLPRHWGSISANFNYTRQQLTVGAARPQEYHASLLDQVLINFKNGSNDDRAGWVEKLSKNCLDFVSRKNKGLSEQGNLADDCPVAQQIFIEDAVVAELEWTFALLQSYAFHFNYSTAGIIPVTWTKPAFVTDVLRYNRLREPLETVTTFRTRLSTQAWSLVLRGWKDTLEFILIPACMVVGLGQAVELADVRSRLTAVFKSGAVAWELDGEVVARERVEMLCMELFAELISLTTGELKQEKVQSADLDAAQVTGDVEVPPTAEINGLVVVGGGFEGELETLADFWELPQPDPDHDTPEVEEKQSSALCILDTPDVVDREDGAMLGGEDEPGLAPQEAAGALGPVEEFLNKLACIIETDDQFACDQGVNTLHEEVNPAREKLGEITEEQTEVTNMTNNNAINISSALSLLTKEIQMGIDLASRSGADAFLARDLSKVEEARFIVSEIDTFQKAIAEIANQWEAIVSRQSEEIHEEPVPA